MTRKNQTLFCDCAAKHGRSDDANWGYPMILKSTNDWVHAMFQFATSKSNMVRTNRRTEDHRRNRWVVAIVACLPIFAVPATSQALNLAQSPLFLQNSVQPNIFFMIDDSGSMAWEAVYNPGTNCDSANGVGTLDFTPDTSGSLSGCPSGSPTNYTIARIERLRLCVGFNTLAYDPNTTYTPWRGKDSALVDYKNAWLYGSGTDASPNFTVRTNPYQTSGTFNLASTSSPVTAYRLWTDSDGDGDYDVGECGDQDSSTPNVMFNSMTDSQKKNFANWYSYYRKRDYVMKRALSQIIFDSQARLGLATLHNNNSVGTEVKDVDDISVPVNTTAQADKTALLRNLSRVGPSGGTPLRNALFRVGRYFDGGDGSPSTSNWDSAKSSLFGSTAPPSPILPAASGGRCQQNFAVLATDGYYNDGFSFSSSTANEDGNADSAFDVPVPPATSNPYSDNQNDTLADIAMYYYERDLRADSTMTNFVPYTEGVDRLTEGTLTPGDISTDDTDGTLMHQHLVTYTVAFGLSGELDPPIQGQPQKTATVCDTDPTDPCWVGWPDMTPSSMEDEPEAVDDLWHAAVNGRGKFLSGRNPTLLAEALQAAIADISVRTNGTASSVSISSTGVSSGTRVFVPRFTSKDWYGQLVAYGFDSNNQLIDVSDWGASPSDAGALLQQNWGSRTILTHSGAVGTGAGLAFTWSSLTTAQQNELDKNPTTGLPDSPAPLGQQRLAYLRGDPANETTLFRERTYDVNNPLPPPAVLTKQFVLGDIVNSSPVYVGAPSSFYSGSSYATFRGTYANRTPMLYVGANDGMLHGFDTTTGIERIAYVPNKLFPKLNRLTDRNYIHSYYVDGTPTVGDAAIGPAGEWRTVLVGGLRGGGQGIYALDVTDPSDFSQSNTDTVLWEFTDASGGTDGRDLGYTFSQPVIAKSHDPNNPWVAIFGNGYNNSEADGIASTTGIGALFVVDLRDGSLVRKIPLTGYGSVASPNGLATVKVIDFDGDAVADFAYGGDLFGNLWKIDLRNTNPASWSASRLFKGENPTGVAQPITSKLEVIRHPTGNGFLVMFGTGKYLESGATDTANTNIQTFYGIWDVLGSGTGTNTLVTSGQLLAQVVSETTDASGDPVRTFTSASQLTSWGTGAGQYMGWKVNFPTAGERHITSAQYLSDNRVLFVTSIPSDDPCAAGGDSWLWQLNTNNGGPPPSSVFDTDGDGNFTPADNAGGNVVVGVKLAGIAPAPTVVDTNDGRLIITPKSGQATGGSLGKGIEGTDSDDDPDRKRQSWRQLY